MDGMHDLGGKQGFGPVRHSPKAQAFHADWEKRVNAMYSLAVKQGEWRTGPKPCFPPRSCMPSIVLLLI